MPLKLEFGTKKVPKIPKKMINDAYLGVHMEHINFLTFSTSLHKLKHPNLYDLLDVIQIDSTTLVIEDEYSTHTQLHADKKNQILIILTGAK